MSDENNRKQYRMLLESYDRCFEKHVSSGVVFLSPDGILIDDTVEIAPGATILPGTILRGSTKIGAGSVIGPHSLLEDALVGERVRFNASQGYRCTIKDGASIGPFCHIRPDSFICEDVHLGDYVEIKNSTIGAGTSVSHLTYIGDSDVGKDCNFGCGVAVANYDGEVKHRSRVDDYAFIGCNTSLVSPVHIGKGAYTAAGSVITEDIPDGALGIARSRQVNKEDWAARKPTAYVRKHEDAQRQDD